MRADEPINVPKVIFIGEDTCTDYINQLRVDRLMRGKKIAELEEKIAELEIKLYKFRVYDLVPRITKSFRIAEALEARAKRIKKGM